MNHNGPARRRQVRGVHEAGVEIPVVVSIVQPRTAALLVMCIHYVSASSSPILHLEWLRSRLILLGIEVDYQWEKHRLENEAMRPVRI